MHFFQDGDVVEPANSSHKLCEFFISTVGFIEALHAPGICSGKAIGPRKLFAKIVGQIVDNSLAQYLPAASRRSSVQYRRGTIFGAGAVGPLAAYSARLR